MGGEGWQLLFGELGASFFWFHLVMISELSRKHALRGVGPLDIPAAGFCSAQLTSLVGGI